MCVLFGLINKVLPTFNLKHGSKRNIFFLKKEEINKKRRKIEDEEEEREGFVSVLTNGDSIIFGNMYS